MTGISITDFNDDGSLSFDLADVLLVLGQRSLQSTWSVRGVECMGDAAAQVAFDSAQPIAGDELMRLATSVTQVIDGVFDGYDPDSRTPWVSIRAVDSSAFDVLTTDAETLAKLRRRFRSVVSIPGPEV